MYETKGVRLNWSFKINEIVKTNDFLQFLFL